MPASNTPFWQEKFGGTVLRDERNLIQLREHDWRTAVVWECALKPRLIGISVDRLAAWLKSDDPAIELPAADTG